MQAAENLESGIANYGSTEAQKLLSRVRRPQKASASPVLILGCIFVPWLMFIVTYYALAFNIRYWVVYVSYTVVAIIFFICITFAWMSIQAARGKGGDPLWLGLLCFLSLVGWVWAVCEGNAVYSSLTLPYYDIQQLNVYESVDPSKSEGNQYMDFGVIRFAENARIDRVFSMAFKNDLTYCVAPVKVNGTNPSSYDFWAVGINCCTSHLYDFRCGEWNNPEARSGLRVMQESERSFYQLAARQAAATFNIPAHHPVFFEWVSEPKVQIDGYKDNAVQSFVIAMFFFFCVEVVAVVVATWAFSKV